MPENLARLKIQLNFKKLHQALLLLFGINIFFLAGTWLYVRLRGVHLPNPVKRLAGQLNLGDENVAASWYSSMLLFLVGLAAGLCFLADNQRLKTGKGRIINLGWLVFVLIFVTLSFDEMGSFHEVIGNSDLFKSAGKGVTGGGWYIFYLLIGAVGIFMMVFSLLKFFGRWSSLAFAVLGILLFLSNPIQENYEIGSWRRSLNPAAWQRPVIFLLLEEGSELFGSYCFLFSFLLYLRFSVLEFSVTQKSRPGVELPSRKRLLIQTLLFMALIAVIKIWGDLFIPVPRLANSSVPENWYPSATAFFLFLVLLYLLATVNMSKTLYRSLIVTAVFSTFMSLFFGANLYGFHDLFFQFFKFATITGTVVAGILMSVKLGNTIAKYAAAAGAVLGIASLLANDTALSSLGYILFALFIYAIERNFSDNEFNVFKP